MCGQAYLTSSRIAAESTGPFEGYAVNQQPFLEVIRMHRDSVARIHRHNIPTALYQGAQQCWDDAYESGRRHGYRNGQVTVIAPTGTIGFMMDCDTTGIEPTWRSSSTRSWWAAESSRSSTTRSRRARQAGLLAPTGGGDRLPHRFHRHHRRRAAAQARAPGGVRLQLPPAERHALHHYMGHVRMMAAVQPFHLRRHFEDHQYARRMHGGGDRERLHRKLETGHQGRGYLSRHSKRVQPMSSGAGSAKEKKAAAAPATVTEKVV